MATEPFEITHTDIKDLKIADPHYVFRGLTYGQWSAVWWNNFFSDRPDNYYDPGKGMVFLRGSVDYAYKDSSSKRIYSGQTKEMAYQVLQGTAIFVPVITSINVMGEKYQGVTMQNEISLRNSTRRDTVNGGNLFARIKKSGDDTIFSLVEDLNYFYTESPFFPLSVDENNPFRDKMDGPLEAGQYNAVSGGVYIIISDLGVGKYRLEFGGAGVPDYFTHSIYDIEIISNVKELKDVSNNTSISRMSDWKDNSPTRMDGS